MKTLGHIAFNRAVALGLIHGNWADLPAITRDSWDDVGRTAVMVARSAPVYMPTVLNSLLCELVGSKIGKLDEVERQLIKSKFESVLRRNRSLNRVIET